MTITVTAVAGQLGGESTQALVEMNTVVLEVR